MSNRFLKTLQRKDPATLAAGGSASDGRPLISAGNSQSTPLAALDLARELLRGVENFVLSTPDLDAPTFLRRLRKVSERIQAGSEVEELSLHREWTADSMVEYGQLQRRYLSEREEELWRLLALYQEHQKIESVSNQQFHDTLRGFHERLASVARLEDIRAVRERLQNDLGRLNSLVEQKVKADTERSSVLEEQIQQLELDLIKARDEAQRDSMTGVYHRGAFTEQLQAMLGTPISGALAMLDVDNFKSINDTYGHLAGDQILRRVVEEVCTVARPGDVVGRYGGDEFCLLAPDTTSERLTERLNPIAQCQSVSVRVEDRLLTVTLSISIGVAGSRSGDIPDTLLERADFFLYEAKRSGKGRVCGESDAAARMPPIS